MSKNVDLLSTQKNTKKKGGRKGEEEVHRRMKRATLRDFFRIADENRRVLESEKEEAQKGGVASSPKEDEDEAIVVDNKNLDDVRGEPSDSNMDVDQIPLCINPKDLDSADVPTTPAPDVGSRGNAKEPTTATTVRVLNFLDIILDGSVIRPPVTVR